MGIGNIQPKIEIFNQFRYLPGNWETTLFYQPVIHGVNFRCFYITARDKAWEVLVMCQPFRIFSARLVPAVSVSGSMSQGLGRQHGG